MPTIHIQKRFLPELKLFLLVIAFICNSSAHATGDSAAINFTELQKQARFANAAYQTESEIHRLLESSHYRLTHYHTLADIQVSFFLATNESSKTQVVAIRGTSNIENAMVDISLNLTTDQNTGISLHQGFSLAAKKIYAELKPLLNPEFKIVTTGHSLGGAVALILAMYMDAEHFKIGQVVTFGQPKTTNISGANKIRHIDIIRVVMPFDLVPLIPLFDPLDISNLDVYWHAGKEVVLLADSEYAILDGVDSMLRATRFTQKPLNAENLQHHQMTLYLEMIATKTKASKRVPYQNDFNLFNLFSSE
ncbi:MAG: lipase family protein [Gammaproteobacteria bacterium]|nr:lipase family protein [Gammaproteobacteria bacterium]